MKFISLLTREENREAGLKDEYRGGRQIGSIRLGPDNFFFRSQFKVYYIPYTDIEYYFRRIRQIPARLCCGRVNLDVENLIIGGDGRELAEIQLPGKKAGEALMKELARLSPDARKGFKNSQKLTERTENAT